MTGDCADYEFTEFDLFVLFVLFVLFHVPCRARLAVKSDHSGAGELSGAA